MPSYHVFLVFLFYCGIWPGHQKSQDLFYKNARPVAIRIIGSDGSNEVYGLNDSMGMQRVNFRNPINVNNIKIVVDKVARGKNDTEWFDGIHAVKVLKEISVSEKEALLASRNVSAQALYTIARNRFLIFVIDGALLVAKRGYLSANTQKSVPLPEIRVITKPDQLLALFLDASLWEYGEIKLNLLLDIPRSHIQFLLDSLLKDPDSIICTDWAIVKR